MLDDSAAEFIVHRATDMPQSPEDIRRAYDLACEVYAREFVNELNHKPADVELLRQFASRVGAGGLVLDLGCGPGHTTAHLASLGLRPIGIDLSPGMIAKATSLFPNVEFTVGDFFQLRDPDSSVNGILAFYCIVHLSADELEAAFTEMLRVLRSGGVLLLSFHIGSDRVVKDNFLETGATLEFSPLPVAVVQTALRTAGFYDIEIMERAPYEKEYPTNRCYVFARKV